MARSWIWVLGAQAVLAAHFAWLAGVVLLPLWAARRRWLQFLHLSMMATVLAIMALGKPCPLTYLENALLERSPAGDTYRGGCVGHYLQRLIYVDVPPVVVGTTTAAWLLLWAGVYFGLRRSRRQG